MLEIQHFTKRYGQKTAVEDLSLTIQAGEICALIGHNGAGKTTTLKACCGILPFEEGEILVDGVSIRADPLSCKRKIAYLPDNPDLYEFMTGAKYLAFIADVFGVSGGEREERVRDYAGRLELTEDLGQPISSYSHGMKQKLSVIAALLHRPKLLLMDEPFVGLDPKATHTLKGLMADLCAQGSAIFFSTHVLEVAERLCHRVAMIKSGRLVAAGSMEDVKGDQSLEDVFLELEDDHA